MVDASTMNEDGIVDHVLKNNKQLHSSVDMADRLLAGSTFFCSRALFYYGPLRTERVRLSYLFARSKWPPRCVRYVCVHARRCFENTRTVRITRVARHTSVSPTPDDGRTFTGGVRRFSHTFTLPIAVRMPRTRDTFRNVSGGRDVR